jgi:hypothetical protein
MQDQKTKSQLIKLISEYKLEEAAFYMAAMSLNYIYLAVGFVISYQFYHLFTPKSFPFEYLDFWSKADFGGAMNFVSSYWLVFSTITIFNFLRLFFASKEDIGVHQPYQKLFAGLSTSIFAGVTEEIVYRWLWFFSAIGTVAFSDWLTGGFLFGHGLSYFFFGITKFFVNLATLGILHDYIYSANWLLGAAMIVSALKFREGHESYGATGYWFSWYFGLFTQVIVIKFGLLPAIAVHVIVDVVQDVMIFVYRIFNQPKLKRAKK